MVKQLMGEIEAKLAKLVNGEDEEPYALNQVRPGATQEQLDRFQQDFEVSFTEDIAGLFRYRNGSEFPLQVFYAGYGNTDPMPYVFLSLEEIRETKQYFCNKKKHLLDYPDNYSKEDLERVDIRIRPYLFHTKWIPFAKMASGSAYLMFDFHPTAQGKPGQIIAYVHDPDFVYYVSNGITDLLWQTSQYLDDGWYEEYHP